MSNLKYILSALLLTATTLLLGSCDDFLDITPTGKVIAKTGEEYRELLGYEYKYFPTDRGLTMLRSDELAMSPAYTSSLDYDTYFDLWRWNDDNPSTTTTYYGWRRYYHAIYIANYIIEHQSEITKATTDEVNQLVGESYMMRAYCHFLLCNLYAEPYTQVDPDTTRGVPLSMEADVDQVQSCSSVADVYKQVLADCDEAEKHLNVDTWETGKNYRFNKLSAECLKARAYLYMGQWQQALTAAQAVIKAHPYLENLNTSNTLPNSYASAENILALEQNITGTYATIGRPSASLMSSYLTGDMRRTKFYKRVTSSSYTLTKGGSETYSSSFRSAEFYLTAAEAAARLGERETSEAMLDTLLKNRYTPTVYLQRQQAIAAMSNDELINEILTERYRELAFEGHRWFDLRRTTEPAITKTYNGTSYTLQQGDSRYTLRFPSEAVEANPAIEKWDK